LFGKETVVATVAAAMAVTGGQKQAEVWTEQVGGVKLNYWRYMRNMFFCTV
jgi:hypothetical protein